MQPCEEAKPWRSCSVKLARTQFFLLLKNGTTKRIKTIPSGSFSFLLFLGTRKTNSVNTLNLMIAHFFSLFCGFLQAGEIVLISSQNHCKLKLELKDERERNGDRGREKPSEMTTTQTDMENAWIKHRLVFTCNMQQRKSSLFFLFCFCYWASLVFVPDQTNTSH